MGDTEQRYLPTAVSRASAQRYATGSSSVRFLLDDVATLAMTRQYPSVPEAEDAIGAIVQLGRGIDLLTKRPDASDHAQIDRRWLVGTELGAGIRNVAAAWQNNGGRMTDLAGAAADLTAIIEPGSAAADGLHDPQRWAGQIAFARTAHGCAAAALRFPPYRDIDALTKLLRLSDLAGRLSRVDPPDAAAWAWLDHGVAPDNTADRNLVQAMPKAAIRLVASARRELANGVLDVSGLLAAVAAAESLTSGGWVGAARAGPPAAQGWRVLRAAVAQLDDGSRHSRTATSRTAQLALAARNQASQLHPKGRQHIGLSASLTATRHAINQLPELADLVGLAVSGWAESGRLFARARALTRTEDRVVEVIRDRVVMLKPADVTAVVFAARATGRLSASLAVELDRSAAALGYQPQPGLVTALRTQVRPDLSARDTRWAHGVTRRMQVSDQPASLSALTR